MEQVLLKAGKREEKGKEKCKKIRVKGNVPAIVYGKSVDSMPIAVTEKDFTKVLKTESGQNVIINLQIDENKDKDFLVMVSEIQRDVFQKKILHVDFHKISLDEKVTVSIPVKLIGESLGVKEGGVLDHVLWQIEIETLPMQIPEHVEADISELKIGDSLHVKDIKFPEGVTTTAELEDAVVIIHHPKAEEVAAPVAAVEGEAEAVPAVAAAAAVAAPEAKAAGGGGPEIIKKGKKEEEEK